MIERYLMKAREELKRRYKKRGEVFKEDMEEIVEKIQTELEKYH